jgi:hypothetical protein
VFFIGDKAVGAFNKPPTSISSRGQNGQGLPPASRVLSLCSAQLVNHRDSFTVSLYLTISVSVEHNSGNRVINECGASGRMRTGQGKPKYQNKTRPCATFPPQFSHNFTWDRLHGVLVGRRQLTT